MPINSHKLIDKSLILSEGQALPNNTSVDSTNVVNFVSASGSRLKIEVRAATAISIADSKQLKIVASFGATSSPTDTKYKVLFDRTASGGAFTFAQGDLICSEVLDQDMLGTDEYVKLTYTTTANESSEKVDAYLCAIA